MGLTEFIECSLLLLIASTGIQFGGYHRSQDGAAEDVGFFPQP
jgi:hypothetical protein